ncbi:hypothetical protein [Acidovorax sp. SUPP3334]|uniref:hypothetical protein n=1 Tax=Acidovorax sp. SUPP3334 TaxID=2920881 RepID=UPI0023DE5D7E|nr:hypothetical protein [Acidovorax sp. SUPP3334]GKT24220.1 hypothetical protein AVHM3334_14085 [Acidovorax sp. SUPP3334]
MNFGESFCLIGVGDVLQTIASDPAGYGLPQGWQLRAASSVAALSASASELLEGLDPAATTLFVAVDHNALNHARLELYGAARLRGLRMATLVHARAIVAPDARVADNVWIGAGTLIGRAASISSDVLIHPGTRIDAGAKIGMHSWIGPGASVGTDTEIGAHSVIGADQRLRAGLHIGRHCVIDGTDTPSEHLASGSFIAPHFARPARMIGAGYSFEKRR